MLVEWPKSLSSTMNLWSFAISINFLIAIRDKSFIFFSLVEFFIFFTFKNYAGPLARRTENVKWSSIRFCVRLYIAIYIFIEKIIRFIVLLSIWNQIMLAIATAFFTWLLILI